jgi:hypothetical protein
MTPGVKVRRAAGIAVGTVVWLAGVGCAGLTPAESCQAICDEMAQCQAAVQGSSLAAGPSCPADCLGKIDAFGSYCKSSAAYLADCFQTYSCDGDPVLCSDQASSFAIDCE